MAVDLGHSHFQEGSAKFFLPQFTGLRGMVCESVGPVRHEVSVPFHDSQVRGVALLIQTGWDERWGTGRYWEPGPYLAEHLIFRMIRSGIRLVGVDFPVAGESSDTRLITGGEIPIVENLRNLAALPRVGFKFTIQPLEDAAGIRVVQAWGEAT